MKGVLDASGVTVTLLDVDPLVLDFESTAWDNMEYVGFLFLEDLCNMLALFQHLSLNCVLAPILLHVVSVVFFLVKSSSRRTLAYLSLYTIGQEIHESTFSDNLY